MSKTAKGLSEAFLQKNTVVNIGNYKYYNDGQSTLGQIISSGLIPNRQYSDLSRKPDGLIIKGKDTVLGVVENKKPEDFRSAKQKEEACNQALEVARDLGAKFIIATDTVNDSIWLNAVTGEPLLNEHKNEIRTIFGPYNSDSNEYKNILDLISKIDDKVNAQNSVIGEIEYVDPTKLAEKVWQRLYGFAGAKPEDCLYTFVEIFIFKYLSDLGILTGPENFHSCLDNYSKADSDDLLTYYAQTIRKKIKRLFPAGYDGTTIINGTIFVNSEEVAKEGFGKTFRDILVMFKDFGELKNIDFEFKSKLFELFFKRDREQGGLGQYFTPLKVVQQMVNMTEIKEGMRICDPTCGVGKFILDAASRNIKHFYPIENGKLAPKITIEGFDKGVMTNNNARTIILAKANMLIYFSELLKDNPEITKDLASLFNSSLHLRPSVLGTLDYIPKENEKYDLILANPPYMATGNSDIKEEISKRPALSKLYSVGGIGLESLFMVWIVNALKKNGTALIVVPDGILNRTADKPVREYILKNCNLNAVISLPSNTFFSTSKKTYILSLTKKEDIEVEQTKPVFTYLASSIGETLDSYRFAIEDNDLANAVDLYKGFISNSNLKSLYEQDKRCKVKDYVNFKDTTSTDWTIEKYWSDDEKIDLGLKEKVNTISLVEFRDKISEVVSDISALMSKLNEVL